ncbi:hypothetical protein KI387_013681, partial [Taxus chinensis]
FLSIDCGGEINRTDPETNITWVTDDNYVIGGGLKVDINNSASPFYLQTARVFPKPNNKSCYRLPLTPNVPHLLRLWFNGGTFNGLQQFPRFDFSIETVDMLSFRQLRFQDEQSIPRGERVLLTSGEEVYICLIRSSEEDNLFLSAIELRRLEKGMYDVLKPGQMLRLLGRYDIGADSTARYPQDPFDRMWLPLSIAGSQNVSVVKPISSNNTLNHPPPVVMQTAAVTNSDSLHFSLPEYPIPQIIKSFVLLLYFAEIEQLNGSESRIFDVLINNETSLAHIILQRDFSTREIAFPSNIPQLLLTLQRDSTSSRGPIINAFEHYQLLPSQPSTSPMDGQALEAVKQRFNIKNWISDPCFVVPWEGIQCTNISSSIRVSEINLSGRNLTGSIPPSLAQLTELTLMSLDNNHLTGALPNLSSLTKLERLYLHNNNLSGSVPDWISQLNNLRELVIENNNFSGVIPQKVLDDQPSLEIRYGGNYYLCMNKGECTRSSHTKGHKWRVILGVIVSGFVIMGLVFLVVTRIRRKKKLKSDIRGRLPDYSMVMVPNPSKSQSFSLEEMTTTTENFSHNIGQGGFGSVFWGKLQDEKQIAVKVLSLFSKLGIEQFLNEIDLLSRVHHKNLVSLLGYCNESRDLMLVYEYMPGGSLNQHLHGSNPLKYSELDWKTRLKIALDAAQGLEYLHIGCSPKIIHRDVKTANILLDNNLNGKLADFGISRVAMDEEASHVFTGVKGTAGYLDPKYFNTHKLTEKSDVYSFGVVLLEIICGRRPIDFTLPEEKIDLVKWVTPYVEQLEDPLQILEIADKRLPNNSNMKSISNVAKLAMKCTADEPSSRPTINEVVVEIKEAMRYEATFGEVSGEMSLKYSDLDSRNVSESTSHSSN